MMAVLVGMLAAGMIHAQNDGRSVDLDIASVPGLSGGLTSSTRQGPKVFALSSPAPCLPLAGIESAGSDLWDHVLTIPTSRSLGLLLSTQTFSVEIWNTYRRQQWRLTALSIAGEGGLQVAEPSPLPAKLTPLGSLVFTTTVPRDGVATIANVATFDVAQDRAGGAVTFSPAITVTGMRVTPFPYAADWSKPVRETMSYKTAMTTARNGKEQRACLRLTPRRKVRFQVTSLDARATAQLDALLWDAQPRTFGVPLWMDAVILPPSTSLAAGSTVIPLDTSWPGLWKAGAMAMLWRSPFVWEVQTIQAVAASSIEVMALSMDWSGAGISVVPVIPGRLPDRMSMSRPSWKGGQLDVEFDCDEVPE